MLELLRDHNSLEQHAHVSVINDESPVVRILFDESHSELLRSQEVTELRQVLNANMECEVLPPLVAGKDSLGDGVLDEQNVDILVLAAPTRLFTPHEVSAVEGFVRGGKSLLIANNHESLRQPELNQQINQLLKPFGLHAQQLVSHRPTKVRNLHPHYLSSGIHQLAVKNPAYLRKLNNAPQSVATLPGSDKLFLAAVEVNPGRIIAVGDFSLFRNSNINEDDNQRLALNIFRWLAYQNLLDFADAQISSEIRYGQSGIFSVALINSHVEERLAGIRCLLESDTVALIEKSWTEARPIFAKNKTEVKWLVKPQQLGFQSLTLRVEFPEEFSHLPFNINPVNLDPVVQFNCVPDAEIRLLIHNHQGEIQEMVETGKPFDVEAVICWEPDAKQVPLHLSLKSPSPSLVIEPLTACRWRLTALTEGNWMITLRVQETEQKITRLIYAAPSLHFQITKTERDIVSALEAKVHHRISQIFPEFGIEAIQKIPFKLFTPEDQVRNLYPLHMQERLLEALYVARSEHEEFIPLVDELLFYIAPLYSPKYGCCIPYDPKLAAHLIKKYPSREESIAYNFLWVEGNNRYGKSWLEGNVAALLLHEKYGHGFFYTQTKLGQQLAILYRHGLLRKVDYEVLKSPYLRSLHQDYGQVIQMLNHSALLLNEGFATWFELTGLQHFSGTFEETVYRRKEFLFQDTQLESMVSRSEYFKKFDPRPGSKYQIAYEWLRDIQSRFGADLGLKCVLQAVIKAADVDFGIVEQNGQIQFALDADQIKDLLLDDRKGYETGAQRRMGRIWRAIEDWYDQFPDEQAWQEWQYASLHTESLVNKIVREELGW